MGEICEGYVRDEVRDESLKTPLNKGLLPKNVRDDSKNEISIQNIKKILFFAQHDVRTATEEDPEAEVVGKGFVGRGTEISVELRSEDVAWGEGVAPLGTDVGGEDRGEVATRLGGEGGEEGRAVERTEVMCPDGSGEDAYLTEEVATQGESSTQSFVERP